MATENTKTVPTTFHRFSELPAELRIEIFQLSYIPRRIKLRKHSSRPKLAPRSSCALLLVSHEAHSIFIESYTRCLYEHGLPSQYINFAIDTLCINSGDKGLRNLIKQYPKTMEKVQWLDVRPSDRTGRVDWTACKVQDMTSLRLLTLRWSDLEGELVSGYFFSEPLVETIFGLRRAFLARQSETGQALPVIAALCGPGEQTRGSVIRGAGDLGLALKAPSAVTWERFEVDMSPVWRKNWPGREKYTSRKWLAEEFVSA
ncbi:uncharacterized protein LY89DRAFT_227519 [Mollisia scopiformis]|uniref:2EXR domain-containing protein n=1 Tax=Mollisia scopiformis TaxID=149040 RepID=A0A194WUD4_MOLSC|nr:uncharacterized protein LY89DRAFT_227519 [Mollisia scopiformis]KUJ11571.1 hypothetical protein LY89DRAFT_227519 [Mollisia scopiformis]